MDGRPGIVQPWSDEAERAVLSCMLTDSETIPVVVNRLTEDQFFKLAHAKLFRAIRETYISGQAVDAISVMDALKSSNDFDAVGGASYLGELLDPIGIPGNVESYVRIIHDRFTLRKLGRACRAIEFQIEESKGESADSILQFAESEIFSVTSDIIKKDTRKAKDVLWDTMDLIEDRIRHGGEVPGVPTGFTRLDRMTSGMKKGHLVIVAGRPSMGKTSLAMNIATHAAISHGVGTAVFSLEMSEEELVERMLSAEGKVDSQKLRIGNLSDDDHRRIAHAAGLISEAPIFINDSSGMTPLELKAHLRRLMAEHEIGLVVVDYLQLMSSGDRNLSSNRVAEMTKISRELKVTARELEVPIIALSQLNRGPENREDPRPNLADLRESGAIEQDADIVLFVFREEEYTGPRNKKGEDVAGKAELIIGKQRNGPTGKISVTFDKRYTLFHEEVAGLDATRYTDRKEVASAFPFD